MFPLWTLSREPTCESRAGRSTVNRPSWGGWGVWRWDPCPSPLQGNVAPRSCDDSVTRVGLDRDYLVHPPRPTPLQEHAPAGSAAASLLASRLHPAGASAPACSACFNSFRLHPEVCLLQEGSSDACTHESEALGLGLCTCAVYFEIRATS